jgi:glycosyltransferase involved in cell wall biosynthesis
VLAATSEATARAWAERSGFADATVLDRVALARGLTGGGRRRPAGAVIHSLDWSREEMPQLHLLAAALLAPGATYLADESRSPNPEPVGRAAVLGGAAGAVPDAGRAAARSTAEIARAWRTGRQVGRRRSARPRSVLVPWSGSLAGGVGGSVSHATGILAAMRRSGLRVHLISEFEPPPQLAAAVDEFEVLPPVPAAYRITREVRRLAGNRSFRERLSATLQELDEPMVYSRHQAMATAAADAADAAGVPLVLEWNASERWAIENWTRLPARLKRVVAPAIGVTERSVVRRSSVVAAVSRIAAGMAVESGAPAERVIVSPNAVDPDLVDRAVAAGVPEPTRDTIRVGWIGTFGAWHGSGCLIEALARAGSAPEAVLVGDGVERADSERLAVELGIAGRVRFTGRLANADALRELSSCDVLACPTVPLAGGQPFFGSPTKLFEYMALGRAIVASRIGQIEEVLEDGRTGVLVSPGSPSELAAALDRLAADRAEREELGLKARRAVEASHTWHERATAILDAVAGG